jgi:hypothetical protein
MRRVSAYFVRYPHVLTLVVGAASVGFMLGLAVCASFPGTPCHP